MSGWSISTLVLLGMVLAGFFYGVYKLLRKNGLTLEVGGHWYGKLTFHHADDGSYINQDSLSQSPQSEFSRVSDGSSRTEVEAAINSDKNNV